MPASKPSGLIQRHETAAEKRARVAQEESLRPDKRLPANPPALLNGHKLAQKAWRRLMRLYGEIDAEIVTRLDGDLLAEYCICMEQIVDLDDLRAKLLQDEKIDVDLFVKVDARADRKRAHLLQLRQALYLTPRARAGTAPKQKEKEQPAEDPMENLLDEVTEYVNGEGKA